MKNQSIALKTDHLREQFISSFLSHTSKHDIEESSLSHWTDIAHSFYEFSKNRQKGSPKIRVFNHRHCDDERCFNRTMIEIINDDMPFLVDSITSFINSLGLSVHVMIHPVLRVSRSQGELESIYSRLEEKEGSFFESFIHFEIPELSSPERISFLEEKIASILQDVRLSVEDWPLMRTRLKEAIVSLGLAKSSKAAQEVEEVVDFLHWIDNNHFTFLGYCDYDFIPQEGRTQRPVHSKDGAGILKEQNRQHPHTLFEGVPLSSQNRRFLVEPYPLIITKTTDRSTVHRREPMDAICVKKYDVNGNVCGLRQFLGLFTSSAYTTSTREIPLLRHKVQKTIDRSGFSAQWHDGKALVHIIESLPRDELFQSSEEELFQLSSSVLNLQGRQRLSLFIRHDRFCRFVSCFVYVPKDRYSYELRDSISGILKNVFRGTTVLQQTQVGDLAFARLHFIFGLEKNTVPPYNLEDLERSIHLASLTWTDKVIQLIDRSFSEEKAPLLIERYKGAFTRSYQDYFDTKEAIEDIRIIENLLEQRSDVPLGRVYPFLFKGQDHIKLKLYSGNGPIDLSRILPLLENFGLWVLSEIPFTIQLTEKNIWVHDFLMKLNDESAVNVPQIADIFLNALQQSFLKKIESDGFNRLVLTAGFTAQECTIFRAYAKYLKQLQIPFSQTYIEDVLDKNRHVTKDILALFYAYFDPSLKEPPTGLEKIIEQNLQQITNSDEDRVLRKFYNLIKSTLRTTFFIKDKPYLSFKFAGDKVEDMPLPRPLYEIFVYSPRFEAVHLRGGKVARGGLRWSDRREDFRTEVLGLVKAQMVKNAVIVPVGSKGGFVLKQNFSTREEMLEEGVHCYKNMIRALLDLTDNLVEGHSVPPQNVVCKDEPDPYLVVAADKGTATFSDYANSVSKEYDFWLGDAFASGGSAGYDHKKMAITARGAWESVKHHFGYLGINPDHDEFTVIGVGDMSGDVFGNGMLLSRKVLLKGAFDHRHIFIDPSPQAEESFEERSRLFALARSSWMDYNHHLISKGGGIFDRNAKSIAISPEMRETFDIQADTLTPDQLIKHLLIQPVDLLWFGGIGTFIKSRLESNSDIGDRANDKVRINGQDLRCRVIGEGANLGMTQRGRIEYALAGGRLNTDAIDNSAGVDCSDHEVNIKILLNDLVRKGQLPLDKRDHLLVDMTSEVASLVLQDNIRQNRAISLAYSQGGELLEAQAALMRHLEKIGKLDRSIEFLPDDQEIARRLQLKQGLTRPEISVLLAYSKIFINESLIGSSLLAEPSLEYKLFKYFPLVLQERFPKEIENHPLRAEIIATSITNIVVNRMGMTFVYDVMSETGAEITDVMKVYFIVKELLNLNEIWDALEVIESTSDIYRDVSIRLYKILKRLIIWFLNQEETLSIPELTQAYNAGFECDILSILPASIVDSCQKEKAVLVAQHIPEIFAERLVLLPYILSIPDGIFLSKILDTSLEDILRTYYTIGEDLGLDWIRASIDHLPADNQWQREALSTLLEDSYEYQRMICKSVLTEGGLERWAQRHRSRIEKAKKTFAEVQNLPSPDLAILTVLLRDLHHVASFSH